MTKKNTAFINVKIRDYGSGLPDETGEPWFEEHYSTKKSTGLGLYHAKKILNSFGCDIKLKKPDNGTGTLAIITLRIYYETDNYND